MVLSADVEQFWPSITGVSGFRVWVINKGLGYQGLGGLDFRIRV